MPLHVTRATRADHLVDRLAALLATPLPDPLATEVVAVHSRGIERWIAQELGRRLGAGPGGDGVCANVAFPFPHRLTGDVVAAALGTDPTADPWAPRRLAWHVLGLVAARGPGGFGPLRGGDEARRLGEARHVAELVAGYLVARPAMVAGWLSQVPARWLGGDGRPLRPRDRWQAELVRALVDEVGLPDPLARHRAAVERVAGGAVTLELPPRIALFGITALPGRVLDVVRAVAATRDVHLLLLHPSPALWDRVAAAATAAPAPGGPDWPTPRAHDPTRHVPRHPLLRSWARDVRELQLTLPPPDHVEVVGDEVATPPASAPLLARLQHAVVVDQPLPPVGGGTDPRPELVADDRSVELHDCHGDLRQVEVLRDVLLHLLEECEDLEPRDVIVMCPDIEAFAPLVRAVFGPAEATTDRGTGQLRVRLADRALTAANPVVAVASDLLALAVGRRTRTDVLELLRSEPVRRRFELDDEDVERVDAWLAQSGVRWGVDGSDRARVGLPPLDEHTLRHGLRRMLLGLAMADEDLRTLEDTTPYDGVEGRDADLVGRVAEFVDRLAVTLDRLGRAQPMAAWADALQLGVDLLAAPPRGGEWQRQQLVRVLDDLRAESRAGGGVVDLQVEDVSGLLRHRLAGRPTRAGHRTGDVTVSTLVPMRNVPHRVVVLLGLDDGRFPRRVVVDSDDLVARAPAVGDRDPRGEDRQLLLDAVLAATERLVVIHRGRDVRTNADVPPAVPVAELREAIDRTVVGPGGRRASDWCTTRHHLHPHHPDNFTPGALGTRTGAWGFDEDLLAAARAATAPATTHDTRLVTGTLPPHVPTDPDVVRLDDLLDFLRHPVRHFVTTRLDVRLDAGRDGPDHAMPTELDGLGRWNVGEALLAAWLADQPVDGALEALRGRGALPPGVLADDVAAAVRPVVEGVVALATAEGIVPGPRDTREIDVALPDGRRLQGVVTGLRGWEVLDLGFSKLKPTARLGTWARWLALRAAFPDQPWGAVTIARPAWKDVLVAEARRIDERRLADTTTPLALLAALVDLRDRGLAAPPPLYAATSAKIAHEALQGDPRRNVHFEWRTGTGRRSFDREDRDPYHVLVHGGVRSVDDLFADPAEGDEAAWDGAEHGRVVAWALRCWQPLLRVERPVEWRAAA